MTTKKKAPEKPKGPTHIERKRAAKAAAQKAAVAQRPAQSMKVRVKEGQMIYYGDRRRRSGDVFTLKSLDEFTPRYMEWAEPRARERTTTGKESLRRQHDELLGRRVKDGELDKNPGGMTVGRDDVDDSDPDEDPLGDD